MAAKLWGLRDGLTLAKQLNIKKLYVEIDAKAMVTLIYNPTSISSHPCSSLIYDCRHLLKLFEKAHIHQIFREGNHCVNLLAKEGAFSNDNFVLYCSPPPFLLYQLYADSWGISYPRLCSSLFVLMHFPLHQEKFVDYHYHFLSSFLSNLENKKLMGQGRKINPHHFLSCLLLQPNK